MAQMLRELPSPRGLPVLGNLHQLRISRLHVILEAWARERGSLFRLDMGPEPVLVVAEREAIGAVLRRRPETFRRWTAIGEVLDEMGISGVFNAEGEDWRRQRRLAVTALNADHLHRYYAVIGRAAQRLRDRLAPIAAGGRSIDIHPVFQSYTVDVTSGLAFGEDVNTLTGAHAGLQRHIDGIFEMIARRVNLPVPYWRWVKLPADRELDRSLAALDEAVGGFIERARKRRAENPERPPDNFLEGMLAAPEAYSDAELAGNAMTMLAAGEDTTSHTLGWAAWYLAIRPDVQERVAAEAAEVLGNDGIPDYEAAGRLRYAEAVIRETVRLRSPAPVVFVESVEDTEVGGVAVPAGTRLLLLTRQLALDEDAYPRARHFEPERWLQHGAAEARNYLAFGAGPRVCPGRNLAHLEAKTAVAVLAYAYELTLDEQAPPVYEDFGFTTGPSAVPVYLSERKKAA